MTGKLKAQAEETKAANQQLRASNQQLRATEQQLRAGNQQLRANEQQLRADITERKKVEQQLRRLATVVLDSNDAITIQDFEGNITAWNHGAELMYGYSEEKALQMNVEVLTPPDKMAEQNDFIRRVIAGEAIISFETQRVTKDGRVLDAWLTVTKLVDDTGKPVGIASTERDITERKKLEVKMREAAIQLRTVLETTQEGIIFSDEAGYFHIYNKGMENLTGYTREEANSCGDFTKLIYPDPQEQEKAHSGLRELLEKGTILNTEATITTKARQEKHILITSTVVPYKECKMFLSTYHDITERKKSVEDLRHAAQEWRTTFDSISDMVSIIDGNYKIIRVNKSFADRFKMKPKEIIGKTCYELVHGTNEPPPTCPHRCTLETKIPQHSEYFEPHFDMYLEVTTSPIFNEKDDIIASVHIARDISHRKKLEKNQRLAELGKLVADMAHEVNNPLMIISGNAQLSLLDGTLNEEIKNNLKIIHEETNRAKDIIKRLLKFSRPTKGERKETDINQCTESVTKLIEHQFNLNDVIIKKDLKDGLPAIAIDEKQIQEVLMNLLNNAREAMPDGGTIDISTSLEEDFLRIDVKDSGIGMGEEALSRLFEPFFTTKEKGTGLGLAVCHGIVKAHNGELEFESQLGKGTTVTVMLPIRGGEE